ncbi:MAG: hypothetical protein Q4E09_03965 [Eubacteriales bacterium]|nr:hypothetical protein [Eubacteriales bacterium]
MTEIDKNNKPQKKDGLKLPDEFYQDLGLEPQGLPDLSEAWSDIEARGAAREDLEDLAYLSGTAAPVSEDTQDPDAAADQETASNTDRMSSQTDDLPGATDLEPSTAKRQEGPENSETPVKPSKPHNPKSQVQPTPPHKPEKYTKEASKAPSLRDKFRALRKYFIISVVLNLVLIAALVLLGVFYYKEINSGKRLEPKEEQTTVTSIDLDKTAATGEADSKQDAETERTNSSEEAKDSTADKAKTEKTEDTDKAKKDSSGAAAKASESKSKKPATTKAKATTEAKTTSAKETTTAETSTTKATTEAETSAKPVVTTTVKVTEESKRGSQETSVRETSVKETKARETSARESKAPAETSSKAAKATEAESPLDKALAKAKKLSQEELKDKALNLNYYEMSADPDQHVNDLVVAGGKILNIYDDGFLIVEDYLPGGLTYYYCPWFIRFDKAKDLGLSVGEVVNFYGIYTEMGTYREDSAEQALILEGVDYVSVGW